MGPGAMFHREDYKTVLLLNGQNLQLVTTDYQGSEAFSTLLVDMLGVLEDVVGTRILLRKLQLGFMDAIPFEGAFCDYLTPAVQGLDFVETDHEHRLTTYWCDLDEPGGRLDLKVASVHADNLVPDEITVLELDLDLPFEETHEQMAFVLSIEVKNDFKPPMRLEGLGAELRRYHAITSHVFAKCLTEKAKTDWNYEEL